MELHILTENFAGGRFLAEHGLSYLIEIDGEKVLFDTGHSNVFLKNAKKLGLAIENDVKTVVLSHGHWDHGDGLQFLQNKTLITHPDSFMNRYRKSNGSPVGLSLSKNEIMENFNLVETKSPYHISENLFFLGEIPRLTDFESQKTTFVGENGEPDFVPDDSALAAIVNNRLVVVSGCAHSGICNICEHAKKVTGISEISAVIGGFHLKRRSRQTQQTIIYFKENQIEKVLPSHCTGLPALTAFYKTFKNKWVKTGMQFRFE